MKRKSLIVLTLPLILGIASCAGESTSSSSQTNTETEESSTVITTESSKDSTSSVDPNQLNLKFAIAGDEAILLKVSGNVEEVEIPSTYEGKPVTRIGENAFEGMTKMRKLVLNEGVREIEKSAFFGCTNLDDITLPSSLRKIDNYAFVNIPYL